MPYTVRSFVDIAESENRRGRDVATLDPDVKAVTKQLKKLRREYLKDTESLSQQDPVRLQLREIYRLERSVLRDRRDEFVHSFAERTLTDFENAFFAGTFTFGLSSGPLISGKKTYTSSRGASTVFPLKEAARAVARLVDKDPPSRNGVVRALKTALGKPYEHAILRLDIANFFESIPHGTLLSALGSLDSVSLSLTRTLLDEYAELCGHRVGIPRGIGLSSQLAEIYLNDLDVTTMGQPGVLFYARYVDDIIIVLESLEASSRVRAEIASGLSSLSLSENQSKAGGFATDRLGDYPGGQLIEYLGYSFTRAQKQLITGLTQKRKSRRLDRLQISFDSWLATLPNAAWPNHGANGMLLNRVRFLAGNIRLANSKSNVAVGLYFSNSALDVNSAEMAELDEKLQQFLQEHGAKMPPKLKARLAQISFVQWFASKKFLRFSQTQVKQIVHVWEVLGR